MNYLLARDIWDENFIQDLGDPSLNKTLLATVDYSAFNPYLRIHIEKKFKEIARNVYYGDIVVAKSCEGPGLGLMTAADCAVVVHLHALGINIGLPLPHWPKLGSPLRKKLDARTDAEKQITEDPNVPPSSEKVNRLIKTVLKISLEDLDRALEDPRVRKVIRDRLVKHDL